MGHISQGKGSSHCMGHNRMHIAFSASSGNSRNCRGLIKFHPFCAILAKTVEFSDFKPLPAVGRLPEIFDVLALIKMVKIQGVRLLILKLVDFSDIEKSYKRHASIRDECSDINSRAQVIVMHAPSSCRAPKPAFSNKMLLGLILAMFFQSIAILISPVDGVFQIIDGGLLQGS